MGAGPPPCCLPLVNATSPPGVTEDTQWSCRAVSDTPAHVFSRNVRDAVIGPLGSWDGRWSALDHCISSAGQMRVGSSGAFISAARIPLSSRLKIPCEVKSAGALFDPETLASEKPVPSIR